MSETEEMLEAVMQEERTTHNTVRFNEVVADPRIASVLNTVYVPKTSLARLGWKPGDEIKVILMVARP